MAALTRYSARLDELFPDWRVYENAPWRFDTPVAPPDLTDAAPGSARWHG